MGKITDRYEPTERIHVDPVMELLLHCETLRLTCIMLIDFIREVSTYANYDETPEIISIKARDLLRAMGEIE
jgi:hypothetical protein